LAEFASRADEIARALRDEILRGGYRPGERLPSERDLAARMGANRSSVREALAAEEGVRRLLRAGRERLLKVLEARAARPA
jgi:GntR family transcriptional repressor for pyruvate dehydrogenase complex